MTASSSASALIGTASVAGVVAAFYYSTQRGDIQAVAAKPIPFGEESLKALRNRLRRKVGVAVAVLVLHAPLMVLFVLGALDAIGSVDTSQNADPVKVAVVVVAGLALLHAWVIGADLLTLRKRLRELPEA